MKAKLNENRPVAWVVLVCVVLLSISLSGGAGLRSLRKTAVDVFHYGVNGDNLSIYNDIQERVSCAYKLAAAAERYDEFPQNLIDDVQKAAAKVESDGDTDIRGLKADNAQLDRAVQALYKEIENAEISSVDKDHALSDHREFNSRGYSIGHDGYNVLADEFNSVLKGFPASVVAVLSGVRSLELFR